MPSSRRRTVPVLVAGIVASIGLSEAACTTETNVDPPIGVAGSSGSAGSSRVPVAGAAPDPVLGGGAGSNTAGSLPAGAGAGIGGASTIGGSGPAGGGAGAEAGTGGAGASGGAPSASGCNWLKAADGTLSMNPAAADKRVLFDGTNLSQWHRLNQPDTKAQWKVLADGSLEVAPQPTPTNIQSNPQFDDVCLHVEYWTPAYNAGVGVQMQGNSGVYLKSAYEMQVLDTSQLGKSIDGCGAVYKVSPPLVVACTPHQTWNTYEIEFKGSVWDASSPPKKTQHAMFVQVALNGKLVQRNVTLNLPASATEAGISEGLGPQPIALQDHRDYVRYRNLWATVPRY